MEEKKSILIGFKVTPSQHQKILEKCELAEVTVSEYMRMAALEKEIHVVKGLPELIVALNRVGNNVNQIAKHANTYRGYVTENDVGGLQQELKGIRYDLKRLQSKVVK